MQRLVRFARRPVDLLDRLLDRVTSYRLVLYVLLAIYVLGLILSLFGQVPFKFLDLLVSGVFLVAVSYYVNFLLALFLNTPKNKDSDLITGLILALILTPAINKSDYAVLAAAALAAQLSKYLLVLGRRHVLNPAAVGAVVAGLAFHNYASWRVGSAALTPLVAVGGLMIIRKMNRILLVLAFIAAYLLVLAFRALAAGHSPAQVGHEWWLVVSASSLLFFATIMVTEPQTSPYKKIAYFPYAVAVAVLSGVTKFRLPPEEALLIGNGLAYILEPARRLKLTLEDKIKEADDIYSYVFKSTEDLKYQPGQYMEWTLPVNQTDSRGNRRYLTIASAPEESEIMFAVKQPAEGSSSFKTRLSQLSPGEYILASHPAGSFTLPGPETKIAMVAGGVGITPFRSMVQHLLLTRQDRSLVLVYAAGSPGEFAFRDLWTKAKKSGLKTVYVVTGANPPAHWGGRRGKVDAKLLKDVVPDWRERTYYLSGPYGFVQSVREELLASGLPQHRIVSDYFPGYG